MAFRKFLTDHPAVAASLGGADAPELQARRSPVRWVQQRSPGSAGLVRLAGKQLSCSCLTCRTATSRAAAWYVRLECSSLEAWLQQEAVPLCCCVHYTLCLPLQAAFSTVTG